jgi:anti-anti-sigma factor
VLGREPGTQHWIPPDVGRPTEQVEGVLVFLPYSPIWFGNADYLTDLLRRLARQRGPALRVVVLDCNAVSDMDFTGCQALADLTDEWRRRGLTLAIARSSHLVHHYLKHSGLLAMIGSDKLFASVDEAVRSLAPD